MDVFSTSVTYHQAITMGVAILVALALRFLLYRTRIGIAMRASVDDHALATLNGARPARVAMLAWATGCVLAAIGGILIAPGAGLDAGLLSLLIVNAYAAAIIGRLRSLPLTFVGAVVLGLTPTPLSGYLPNGSRYPQGLRIASPAIVLFVVLLLIPNPRLPGRARSREYFPSPSWSGALGLAAATVLGAAVLATTLSAGRRDDLRTDLPLRDLRALARTAHRIRRKDLAVSSSRSRPSARRCGPNGARTGTRSGSSAHRSSPR